MTLVFSIPSMCYSFVYLQYQTAFPCFNIIYPLKVIMMLSSNVNTSTVNDMCVSVSITKDVYDLLHGVLKIPRATEVVIKLYVNGKVTIQNV